MSLFTIVRVVGTTQERLVGGPRAGALATSISFLLFLYCLVTLLVLCLHLLVICFQKSRPFFPVTMFAILRIVSPILRAKLVTDCFFLFSLPRFLLFLPPRNKNSNQSRTLVELKICNSLGKKKKKKKKGKVNKFDRVSAKRSGRRMCASFFNQGSTFLNSFERSTNISSIRTRIDLLLFYGLTIQSIASRIKDSAVQASQR